MLEEHYPEISKALEGIAMVEMRHYKILSQLMLELGVDPYLNNRIRTLPMDISDKNGKDIICKVKKTLLRSMAEESDANEEYLKLAKCSGNKKTQKFLKELPTTKSPMQKYSLKRYTSLRFSVVHTLLIFAWYNNGVFFIERR